jgi:hypothetical protein
MIPSRLQKLDDFLGGGLAAGQLSEWGLPLGQDARRLLLLFVRQVQEQQGLVLWVHGHPGWMPYPAPWFAYGVCPEQLVFAYTEEPLAHLKQAWVQPEPVFGWVVMDLAWPLAAAEYAFLATCARKHRMHIALIRPVCLSNRNGNPWTRIRINVTANAHGGWKLCAIKGVAKPSLMVTKNELDEFHETVL